MVRQKKDLVFFELFQGFPQRAQDEAVHILDGLDLQFRIAHMPRFVRRFHVDGDKSRLLRLFTAYSAFST